MPLVSEIVFNSIHLTVKVFCGVQKKNVKVFCYFTNQQLLPVLSVSEKNSLVRLNHLEIFVTVKCVEERLKTLKP